MKHILIGLLVAMVSIGCFNDEWKQLFDGQGFSGWTFHVFDGSPPENIWEVRDEIIVVNGKDQSNGVLCTEKSYSNYELKYEWRWMDSKGNSGCLIHCSIPKTMKSWPTSLEVQLGSGNAGDFIFLGETADVDEKQITKNKEGKPGRRRANLTDDSENPGGEWNKMHIIANNSKVEVYVNGDFVNKGWNTSANEGAICFQAERANIQFRNIRIMEYLNRSSE